MEVSVIGWYGTETLGDLAILDGIFSVLNDITSEVTVKIGSLYPFYSRRTLYEEAGVFCDTAPDLNIKIFDVRNKEEARENIKNSDALIIGGGPLMDLKEMLLLCNCFRIAKEYNVPRIVMGCGVGPLKQEQYIRVFKEMMEMATEIYLRDEMSLKIYQSICGADQDVKVMGDPALISVERFRSEYVSERKDKKRRLVINFRDYPSNEYGKESCFSVEECRRILNCVCDKYDEVYLVPMHTFCIGGDDRLFLTKVIWGQNYPNVTVCHRPMNLYELYRTYSDATACIGMRYHSVVMQTILNGNNFIVEYTDPVSGKISGFIDFIKCKGFYENRCWSIRDELQIERIDILQKEERYMYQESNVKKEYVDALKKCMAEKGNV